MHQSVSKIPPKNLIKYRAISKQTPISNFFLNRFIKRFGFNQLGTYLRTRRKNRELTYPYMPRIISEEDYLYDFHIHTHWSDGKGSYKEILNRIFQKKHLNGGIAITDHPFKPGSNKYLRYIDNKAIERTFKINSIISDFKKKGKLPEQFISFPGSCEFLTRLKESNPIEIEIIALGVPKDFIKKNRGIRNITNNMYAVELIERIHDNNGLAILPHPFYYTKSSELLRQKLSRNSRPDAFEGINYSVGFLSGAAVGK